MKILGIETSCDDTGIAVLKVKRTKIPVFDIQSNIISSQTEIHKKYGGVYPIMARREHQKNLVPVLNKALKEAGLLRTKRALIKNLRGIDKILEREKDLSKDLIIFLQKYAKPDIDLIAVTNGPGLDPCLWVGVNFAKALSCFWDIPIIPVNHIEAHTLVNLINSKPGNLFPAIALIVSGGHTQLILVKNIGKYKILGETRDDAAGECFDKTARILGLDYPGGPAIAQKASGLKDTSKFGIKLPQPMINSKDYDFSFSGLKTAVLYAHLKKSAKIKKDKEYICEMAKEIQQSIIDVLIKKTITAARDYKTKAIILGGGVTANKELRKQFTENIKKNLPNVQQLVPDTELCTDNGVMAAITGYFHSGKTKNWKSIKAEPNLRVGE
ncbi:MAG: tRNA (adenosine(37)-N6)-threonylcarbamoyltransferase complex transferase subunit TsaD [Candidatus Staskawiczbacteria bacterium]|jgi:N6-L-threonylcarbamoyladenine synthase